MLCISSVNSQNNQIKRLSPFAGERTESQRGFDFCKHGNENSFMNCVYLLNFFLVYSIE